MTIKIISLKEAFECDQCGITAEFEGPLPRSHPTMPNGWVKWRASRRPTQSLTRTEGDLMARETNHFHEIACLDDFLKEEMYAWRTDIIEEYRKEAAEDES